MKRAKKPVDTVLIVGAHHEEVEAEFPNIAAKLSEKGCRVVILNPVGGWNWSFIRGLPGDGRKRTIAEATAAARALGCEKVIWDFPVAEVVEMKLELMRRMADFMLDVNPSIILTHWPLDSHCDHRAVARVCRHVINTAENLVESLDRKLDVREVYAFQAGLTQTYNFQPDFLVLADKKSMARAEKSLKCFHGTAKEKAMCWWENVKAKANSWKPVTGGKPAEPLKFLGPRLPANGFRLAEILGEDLVPTPLDRWYYEGPGSL